MAKELLAQSVDSLFTPELLDSLWTTDVEFEGFPVSESSVSTRFPGYYCKDITDAFSVLTIRYGWFCINCRRKKGIFLCTSLD